jgi:prepilin-type N-terminal cleavage/methylation domain-containing protein
MAMHGVGQEMRTTEARTHPPHARTTTPVARPHSFREEHGFTLVEVLAACAVISIGVAATLRIFGASGRTVLRSERTEVAVQRAQGELDEMRTIPYAQLALTTLPNASSDPKDPGSRVVGTTLRIRTDLTEDFVMTVPDGQTPAVDPAPKDFSVGLRGATITGHIYRYVTWRNENCPFALCDGTQNTKRLTVAVVLDTESTGERRAPLWFSTVVADPNAAPPGAQAPPGGGPGSGDPVTAASFFLFDTPCGQSSRQTPSANHATHDTASVGASAADDSTCENPNATKQPDLMGAPAPPGDDTTPLYKYSNDLSGGYDGGLTMLHRGSTCASSYASTDASNDQAVSKWSMHDWSTQAFSQAFTMRGLITVSLFTTVVGGVQAAGRMCATVIDRQTTSGVPTDRVLGTGIYDLSSWPTDVRRLTFSFNLSQEETVPAGHRLVLALQLRGESGADVSILYDHPLFPSLLEVATTTPL